MDDVLGFVVVVVCTIGAGTYAIYKAKKGYGLAYMWGKWSPFVVYRILVAPDLARNIERLYLFLLGALLILCGIGILLIRLG